MAHLFGYTTLGDYRMLQFISFELVQKVQDIIKVKQTLAHFCPVEGMGTANLLRSHTKDSTLNDG